MDKEVLIFCAVLALLIAIISMMVSYFADLHYISILATGIAVFIFVMILGLITNIVNKANEIEIKKLKDEEIHIEFTAFQMSFYRQKTWINIGCWLIGVLLMAFYIKGLSIWLGFTRPANVVSPFDLLATLPALFIYRKIFLSNKYSISIQAHHIDLQSAWQQYHIPFEQIRSYYVQSLKDSYHQEWRITLKTGEHYYYIIPYDVHKHLRSWFMAHGMRAKQLKQ